MYEWHDDWQESSGCMKYNSPRIEPRTLCIYDLSIIRELLLLRFIHFSLICHADAACIHPFGSSSTPVGRVITKRVHIHVPST